MRFAQYNFSENLIQNLTNLGFKRPTDIQFKAIPSIIKGEDVLAIAQTGTGKTAAYAIPVIEILNRNNIEVFENSIRCLIMVPTHELAMQVCEVFEKLSIGLNLKILGIFGGVNIEPQIKQLKKGVDVLIATPGRLFDLEHQKFLSLNNVEFLVIDEADRMFECGFIEQMHHLITKLPRNRQTLFFSATISKEIKDLAYSMVNNAVRIQISPKDTVSKTINHSVIFVEMDDKRFFAERIIKENAEKKFLIFVRTKIRAERVCKALERVGIISETMHSDKNQTQRDNVMKSFKNGKSKILIATDISARGIDIPDIDIVINYDLPEQAENYVHRVGRTGRADRKGTAISFCSSEEKELLNEILGFINNEIKVIKMNNADYEQTIDLSENSEHDWQALIDEDENFKKKCKKK